MREQGRGLRKAGKVAEADALLTTLEAAEKAAREASSRAQAIDDAVYDLKAINPHERKAAETRTPTELLDAIANKGKEVDAALTRLRALL